MHMYGAICYSDYIIKEIVGGEYNITFFEYFELERLNYEDII